MPMPNTCKKSHQRQPITEVVMSGKVRNIHAFTGLVFETSNRLSVFDRVIKEDVPLKGAMLNAISQHNKVFLEDRGIQTDYIGVPDSFFTTIGFDAKDTGRLCYSKTLEMLPFEFIVRAFLVGSAYKAYKKGESYCGYTFPEGLKEGDRLPEAIVTPTTKESTGHDRPVTKEEAVKILTIWLIENGYIESVEGLKSIYHEPAERDHFFNDVIPGLDEDSIKYGLESSEDKWEQAQYSLAHCYTKIYINLAYQESLTIFKLLSDQCEKKGIIFVDTKFEFGLDENSDLILADEVGTPDSSRFASVKGYQETGKLTSMDKQIVRDYCTSIGFNGDADQPIPDVPDDVWKKVTSTYVNIAETICGKKEIKKYLV